MNPLLYILPAAFVVIGYTEMRYRRIPNWITFGMICIGIAGATLSISTVTLSQSLTGFLIGAGVFLPFCLTGAAGGGDLKFAAGIGAIVGQPLIWKVLYFTCYAGGAIALIYLIWTGQLGAGLRNTCRLAFRMKSRESTAITTTVPYGIALIVGTLVAIASVVD